MKIKPCVLLALSVAGAFALRAVEFTVAQMPVSPFADTEVSTNMVINKADINYVDLKFTFCGTPTNDLEMAFGTDVNTNGVLDAEEVEHGVLGLNKRLACKGALAVDVSLTELLFSDIDAGGLEGFPKDFAPVGAGGVYCAAVVEDYGADVHHSECKI